MYIVKCVSIYGQLMDSTMCICAVMRALRFAEGMKWLSTGPNQGWPIRPSSIDGTENHLRDSDFRQAVTLNILYLCNNDFRRIQYSQALSYCDITGQRSCFRPWAHRLPCNSPQRLGKLLVLSRSKLIGQLCSPDEMPARI